MLSARQLPLILPSSKIQIKFHIVKNNCSFPFFGIPRNITLFLDTVSYSTGKSLSDDVCTVRYHLSIIEHPKSSLLQPLLHFAPPTSISEMKDFDEWVAILILWRMQIMLASQP